MKSSDIGFQLPNDVMTLFSGVPQKWDSKVPALFLAETPLIVCNFKQNAWLDDFLLRLIVEHEMIHRMFIFEFLPLQAYFWTEIHALQAFQRVLSNGHHGILRIQTSDMRSIAPLALLELPNIVPAITRDHLWVLDLLCEGYALYAHAFVGDTPWKEQQIFLRGALHPHNPPLYLNTRNKILDLHERKGFATHDFLTILNMCSMAKPNSDQQFDDFTSVIHNPVLLDSDCDSQERAVASLLSKGTIWFQELMMGRFSDKTIDILLNNATDLFGRVLNLIWEQLQNCLKEDLETPPATRVNLITFNLIASIFTSFYHYASRYTTTKQFDAFCERFYWAGTGSSHVWFTDLLELVDLPTPPGFMKRANHPHTHLHAKAFIEDKMRHNTSLYWFDFLISRRVRAWLSGRKRRLVCPIYEYFQDSFEENADRLQQTCDVGCQSETYCCVATDTLDLEKVDSMKCAFARALEHIFEGIERVEITD